MKHILSIIVLSLMTVSVMAVQYPKKPYTGSGAAYHAPVTYQQQAGQKHGSLTPIGASTPSTYPTVGASAPIVGGPRRVSYNEGNYDGAYSEGLPDGEFKEGDTFTDDKGVVWVYTTMGWAKMSNSGDTQGSADAENQIPLGSTWVMLLFAALFAGYVGLRRRPQA